MAAVYTYNTAPACLLLELGARHGLLNLSVYNLVEERRNYGLCLLCLIRLRH
ncbi:hypothetical protein HBH50_066470 [Parastagonospora nodorum]|nr:hypothetical protein HBH50_066470 [Parastagonospora nodorum]KAH4094525.1 hypothetical protein HBH48_054750 [Parastagonospora nodorum]